MSIKVTLYEYGTNRELGKVDMNSDAVPRVGEFLILDNEIKDNYLENMYLVKCITTLLPKEHCYAGDKCVHIEKFNPDEEQKKWDDLREKWSQLGNKEGKNA